MLTPSTAAAETPATDATEPTRAQVTSVTASATVRRRTSGRDDVELEGAGERVGGGRVTDGAVDRMTAVDGAGPGVTVVVDDDVQRARRRGAGQVDLDGGDARGVGRVEPPLEAGDGDAV